MTTNRATGAFPSAFAQACTASMARTALLTIGKSRGQLSSLVSRKRTNVSEISVSSVFPPMSGWLGTCGSTAQRAPQSRARANPCASSLSLGLLVVLPPVMKSRTASPSPRPVGS